VGFIARRRPANQTLLLRNDPTAFGLSRSFPNSAVSRSRRSIHLKKRDVTNHQLVAANQGKIVIAKPKQVMTKQEALIHAAWIVALADDKDEFERILEDVMAM
jgi:hypothetical protein